MCSSYFGLCLMLKGHFHTCYAINTQSIIVVVIHHKRSNGGMPKDRGQTATDDDKTNMGTDDDDDTCFSHNHHHHQRPCSVTYAYTTHRELAEKSFPLALSNTVTLDHSFKGLGVHIQTFTRTLCIHALTMHSNLCCVVTEAVTACDNSFCVRILMVCS